MDIFIDEMGMDYNDKVDATGEDDFDVDCWIHAYISARRHLMLSDMSTDGGFRSSTSVCQSPLNYFASAGDLPCPPSVKDKAKESDTERRARLLQEMKKNNEKAEKKRLKKQKQKQRKQLEKLEKEKQNPIKNKEAEDEARQSEAEDSKAANDKSTDDTNSSVKNLASTEDTQSSEDESSDEDSETKSDFCDSEELDMTSTFVTKAALIAKRKSEQKPRPERKEKNKSPVKEHKSFPHKPNEESALEKKDSAATSAPTFEDNLKISTELAVIGNKFASSGDFTMAVKYFTDAIKYNPTELKLFGNRSFCFEKMQEYEKALTDAELCLNMCPGWVKGLFRKGRALAGLKRYGEAAQAFRQVLNLDDSYAEAAQELMRVQITQLMEYGFTREQSSNALIIHGTVKKAQEVLSKLNHQQGALRNGAPAEVVNMSGVSPVLLAKANQSNKQTVGQPKPSFDPTMKSNHKNSQPPPELFPVWVGNLVDPVTESVLTDLFNKAGVVYSVKLLAARRCAFVNFTKQEYCDEAIQRFHGFGLNGMRIAVRYPDRIPRGMGISKSAHIAEDLQDETRQSGVGSQRPVRPYRHFSDRRDDYK